MIEVRGLAKVYSNGGTTIRAIDQVSFSVSEEDFVVAHGPSGSGKSTLLLTLGGMLRPSCGTICYRGRDIYALSATRRNEYRKHTVGFIFQKFFLIPYLTALDNIRLPLALRRHCDDAGQTIVALSERLGIADRLNHRPAELSAGEQQRVAMARTLAGGPRIILADEPTGNLDQDNADILAECLKEEHRRGRVVILVTHNRGLLDLGNRRLHIDSGRIR
jgi:putative ABC transport system ATP-binding protein